MTTHQWLGTDGLYHDVRCVPPPGVAKAVPPERCHPAFEYHGERSRRAYVEYVVMELFSIVMLLVGAYCLIWLSQSSP